MNLCIDIGNTISKIAVFSNGTLIHIELAEVLTTNKLEEIGSAFPELHGVILCTVRQNSGVLAGYLRDTYPGFIDFSHLTPIPVTNLYKTPETLGKDRLAGVVAANNMFPDSNVLVIDAGTALTFDLVEANGKYPGGNISPGLHMRFRALHQFTGKLPLVEASGEIHDYGTATDGAIRSGVLRGMIFEMDGYIDELKKRNKNLKTILTGGDSIFFVDKLKNAIFVDENLVLKGLNRIIQYNAATI